MTRPVCLGVLVISLIAACGCGATKQSYVAKGNKLFAAGKYRDAALNYRAAIQKDAGFGEAHYRLGLAAIKLQEARQAYTELLRAVELLPANAEVKREFADVCLSLYLADPSHPQVLYTQIGSLADEFLSKHRNSYEGLMLKGYLASTDRKPKEAIEYFRKALGENPSNDGVVTELAHLLIEDGQAKQGEQLAGDAIRRKTSYGPAYDLLYTFYLDTNRSADAEAILQAKVNNNPKNAGFALQLARHYNQVRNASAMTATLQRLLDNPKDFPQAQLWVGDFYLGLHHSAEAIAYYQQGAKASQDAKTKVVYETRNVVALLDQGKKDDALDLAQRMRQENPADNAVLRLHADLVLSGGKSENADGIVREFQTLSAQNPADPGLRVQLGRAYRLKGDPDSAHKQFLEAIHLRHDLSAARYELAEIGLMQHRPLEAVEQTREILNSQPDDRRARFLYGIGLIGIGDVETARGVLSRLIGEGGDASVYAALSSAYMRQNNLEQARTVLNAGLSKWPSSSILLERLAEVFDIQGDHNRALEYYQEAHQFAPNDVAPAVNLADALARASRLDEARALYNEVAKAHPDNAPALNNAAFFLADTGGDLDQALRLAKDAQAKIPGEDSFSDTVAYIYLKKGMLESAIQSFSTLARRHPASASFHYHLGMALFQKGDKAVARKELQTALADHPSAQETLRIRELLNKIS